MKSVFDSGTLAVEIDGNKYHLPAALTKALRIKAAKELKAYEHALNGFRDTQIQIQLAGEQAREGDVTAEELAKTLRGLDDDSLAAARKMADTANAVVVKLLTAPGGGELPDGLGDNVADEAAMGYVSELLAQNRVELDPQ